MYSTVGGVEGIWSISGHSLVSLSTQQLIDCSGFGCTGGSVEAGYKWIVSNGGLSTEAAYPITGTQHACNTTAPKTAKISSYTDVAHNSLIALQTAAAQQPVSVNVEADQAAWQLYRSGVVTSNCGTSLDHVVLVVGYSTAATPNYWIAKNSWGTAWGESAYIRIGMSEGSGVCGINMMPSFPNV